MNFILNLQKQYPVLKVILPSMKKIIYYFFLQAEPYILLILINSKEINWIQNFKPETEIIFRANPIVVSKNNIIISTDKKISLLTSNGEKMGFKC